METRTMMMKELKTKVDYDEENDVLYLYSKHKVHESIEIGEDIVLDLDKNGMIIGLELFDAAAFLDATENQTAKKALGQAKNGWLSIKNHRNYALLSFTLLKQGKEVEAKLPPLILSDYESPLIAAFQR